MPRMTKLEVNVRRLLTRCELMAKNDLQKDWKFEKYILALEGMVDQLQTLPDKPPQDTLMGYMKRITFLKDVSGTAKLTSPTDRIVAVQMLAKGNAASADSTGPSIVTQIHRKAVAKYSEEARSELFQSNKGRLRQRLSNTVLQDEDLDALMKYNRDVQEKIAENMLSMTNNMKEHALAASAVIKKDITLLESSDKLTDINATKLREGSLKLEEHRKSNLDCWLWLMIVFVLVTFFNMVLFIKVTTKRL